MGRKEIQLWVVEPDDGYRSLILELLGDAGYQPRAVASGGELLEKVRAGEVDLLLMETCLPDMSGITLLQEIRRLDARLPVIIVSGETSFDLALEAMQNGAFHLIRKPFRMAEIAQVVGKAVKLKKILWKRKQASQLMVHRIELSLPSEMEQIEPTVFYVSELISGICPLDPSQEMDIISGLSEALANAIRHGNREDPDLRVSVEMNCQGRQLEFLIRDQGPGFDAGTLPDPTAMENLLSDCGRGILMMSWCMDRVEFLGRGNQVRLVKQLL